MHNHHQTDAAVPLIEVISFCGQKPVGDRWPWLGGRKLEGCQASVERSQKGAESQTAKKKQRQPIMAILPSGPAGRIAKIGCHCFFFAVWLSAPFWLRSTLAWQP